MLLYFRKITIGLTGLYTGLLCAWFILYQKLGDSLWWLALLNIFAPYLFLPLILLLPLNFISRWRLLWILSLPLLIFAWLYGQLFLPGWPVATNGQHLSVMSFNIWGASRTPATARVILANGSPDIVAIQELRPRMAKIMLKELEGVYKYQVLQAVGGNRGMGVLSRYPLKEVDASHLRASEWQIQIVEVEVNDRIITVYNCHPRSFDVLFYIKHGLPMARPMEAAYQRREALIARLIQDIAGRSTPVIVLGDFNSTDRSDVYALLTSALDNTHQETGWGFGHTYPAQGGGFQGIPILPRQLRLDMIFYSDEFVALSSRVSAIHGESDHLPVVAELAWRE
jgi:endonuclease/exonuclease/phosphatase (EEP) superfamily protein YafD